MTITGRPSHAHDRSIDRLSIIDGGMSTALQARGVVLDPQLWTAAAVVDHPDEITAVHAAYFAAGADIAITASYQASIDGYVTHGLSVTAATAALAATVTLARQAADAAGAGRLVAASIGPYGALLADGSEYRGNYGLSRAELRDVHARRLEILLAAGPDLVAIETIPDLVEAEVVIELLAGTGVPAWLSYTVADGRTRAGQPLDEAFAVATAAAEVFAVGVNCCHPAEVEPALVTAQAATNLAGVAYPNGGGEWDATTATWSTPPVFAATDIDAWLAAGAQLIGGCCEVGPAEIAEIATRAASIRNADSAR